MFRLVLRAAFASLFRFVFVLVLPKFPIVLTFKPFEFVTAKAIGKTTSENTCRGDCPDKNRCVASPFY